MNEDFVLVESERARCEQELLRYRNQSFTEAEWEIQQRAGSPLDAGIEIGFKAAWAYHLRGEES